MQDAKILLFAYRENEAMLKAIIFDFDGVLCDSIEVKKEAFRKKF